MLSNRNVGQSDYVRVNEISRYKAKSRPRASIGDIVALVEAQEAIVDRTRGAYKKKVA